MMKTVAPLLALFLLAISSNAEEKKEKVYSWDALIFEKNFKNTIEDRFPNLQFGFYHWSNLVLFAALEDFDNDRILLVANGVGDFNVKINGKEQALPLGEEERIKVYIPNWTENGTVNGDQSFDERLGFWIKLESTDRFELTVNLEYPSTGNFEARYSPDRDWTTSFLWEKSYDDRKTPADVYEVSRKPVVEQIAFVLKEKDECVYRFKNKNDLSVFKWKPDPDAEILPLNLTITDVILLNLGPAQEAVAAQELRKRLQTYCDGARAAEARAEVRLHVSTKTDDPTFREVLTRLLSSQVNRVYLEEDPE